MVTPLPPAGTPLCRADEVRSGQARGCLPDEDGQDRVFIVRHGEVLHAWRNACPHIPGAPMAWKRHAYLSPEGTQVMCHAHGARFEPDTGLCVHGPCLGRHLLPVPLRQEADGWLRLA
ncbi:Rieske (2Fe-2S) protein [Ideonella livida]|uniref:Rieske (2Fe-2S) protein n=1 Tax=Ideonella livida TaxID=2707176 RepID=A0A7C9TPE6_9BURK|nr:Rieske (2Fe-2S) protein [Ideonella livida]NDY93786.1 Rieske (2Fe-2S) protein [Ideonella livida]